jgi:hypothetical protein
LFGALSNATESPATVCVLPRGMVVVPLTTSCAPAAGALSVSAMRTSPISCDASKR